MDVRIGVSQSPKEIEVELADDADRDALVKQIETSLADAAATLWLTDRKGRTVGVPSAKVAYIEVGSDATERRVGFGN